MEKVKVTRNELLTNINQNRTKHKEEYDEALSGWQEQIVVAFDEARDRVRQGDYSNLSPASGLPKPQHHLKDYDLAIRMLTMSVDEHIEIEMHDFNQYVMDEWSWKAGFALTNSSYLSS